MYFIDFAIAIWYNINGDNMKKDNKNNNDKKNNNFIIPFLT